MTPREALNEVTPLCQEHPEALLALERAVHASETIDGKRFLYEQEKLMSKMQEWRERYHHEVWEHQRNVVEAYNKVRSLEAKVI